MFRRPRTGPFVGLVLLTILSINPPTGCSCGDTTGVEGIQVRILGPTDGSSFTLGRPVTFRGEAYDSRGMLGNDMLSWSSSLDGILGTGQELTRSDLSLGQHLITLSARNESGEEASDTVNIEITPATENQPPVPEILAPTEGESFDQGSQVQFSGRASDHEDGDLTGFSLVWTSNVDGLMGNGRQLTVSSLSLGPHVITLTAVDSGGLTAKDTVGIEIVPVGQNHPPRATIEAPEDGATFLEGNAIEFRGRATDDEDGTIGSDGLAWSSDLDGPLGTGGQFFATLSLGAHVVTLTATDLDGASGAASIALSVNPLGNEPPEVTILEPADNSSFEQGREVTFLGLAEDPEDGELTGEALVWTSDLDGQLATGEEFTTTTLSVGLHWIRLVATDSGQASGSDSIQLRITEQVENLPPTASILQPPNNSSSEYGDPVTFEGSGTDPEDGVLQGAALSWSSNLDGSIGSGTTFTISSLSEGFHLITLTVFDSQAAFDQDSITIEITGQQIENLPPNAVLTGPTEAMAQTDVTLDGSGSWDADGTVVRYVFGFGDGTPVQDGSDSTAVHVFQNDGAYTVTLTVYDDDGATGVATHPILITPYQHLPEVVEDSRDQLGSRCALGFTLDNRPLIAYRNDTHPAVRLAEQLSDGSFLIQTVEGFGLDIGGDAGENVDLATDQAGTIHLAYTFKDADGNTSLRYARDNGTSFDLVLVDQADDRGEYPLTISMNPITLKPEILYSASERASVKHAACQGDCAMLSSWTVNTVYTETRGRSASYNYAFAGGFTIQADGTRHATIGARYENTSYEDMAEVKYAVRSGPGWDLTESVIGLRIQSYYYDDNDASRMTLDQFGQPLVIHYYGVYHRSGPSDWDLSEVESGGLYYFDIAFDPSLDTAYLLNRHGSHIEIIAENERSYWLYESLGPQDQAQPEVQVDLAHQPRACFARDGNIILY